MNPLLPCPFCGAEAKLDEVTEGENFGGQFIECTSPMCGCSTCLMFPSMDSVKEQLAEKWNNRVPELAKALAKLHKIDVETEGCVDGAPDRSEHASLCNRIQEIIHPT